MESDTPLTHRRTAAAARRTRPSSSPDGNHPILSFRKSELCHAPAGNVDRHRGATAGIGRRSGGCPRRQALMVWVSRRSRGARQQPLPRRVMPDVRWALGGTAVRRAERERRPVADATPGTLVRHPKQSLVPAGRLEDRGRSARVRHHLGRIARCCWSAGPTSAGSSAAAPRERGACSRPSPAR